MSKNKWETLLEMRRTTAQRAMSDEAATTAALARRELEAPCEVLWCRRDLEVNTQIVCWFPKNKSLGELRKLSVRFY